MQIKIRSALDTDWPQIENLLRQNQLPTEGAREHLNDFLLACTQHGIVACAGLEIYGQTALLRSVATGESVRKQGIARQLCQCLMLQAGQQGLHQMVLLTTTAEHYFKRLGFVTSDRQSVPTEVRQSIEFRTACPASAIVMQLALPA